MKDNKLIAEFMELPTEVFTKALLPKSSNVNYYFREFNSGSWYEEHELSYNESWDWLVPVIEKIQDKHLENPNLDYDCIDKIRLAVPNIQEVYYLVLEFIKEYNKNIMNTTENNKLIAEFMGEQPKSILGHGKIYKDYSKSWDWLMPVLKKINLEISPNTRGLWRMIINPTEYDIENVYAQVVEFIKEYNNDNR